MHHVSFSSSRLSRFSLRRTSNYLGQNQFDWSDPFGGVYGRWCTSAPRCVGQIQVYMMRMVGFGHVLWVSVGVRVPGCLRY